MLKILPEFCFSISAFNIICPRQVNFSESNICSCSLLNLNHNTLSIDERRLEADQNNLQFSNLPINFERKIRILSKIISYLVDNIFWRPFDPSVRKFTIFLVYKEIFQNILQLTGIGNWRPPTL